MNFVSYEELKGRGNRHTMSQLNRNVKAGLMPAPVKMFSANAWLVDEIEAFQRAQIAKRDYPWLAKELTAWIRKQEASGNKPWSENKIEEWVAKKVQARDESELK